MTPSASRYLPIALAVTAALAGTPAFGQQPSVGQQPVPATPEACLAITGDADRLACYDAAWKSVV